jgi:hypothetical protein
MTDDRRERRFMMDLRTGRIVGLDAPAVDEADDDDRWRPIGEIDPTTGRSSVDLTQARRWRPLSE